MKKWSFLKSKIISKTNFKRVFSIDTDRMNMIN